MLREAWEEANTSIVSYVIATQEKLKAIADLVQENVAKAQSQ